MALSAAFRDRLEHMEHTRNERLSLLQIPIQTLNLPNACLVAEKTEQVERNEPSRRPKSDRFWLRFQAEKEAQANKSQELALKLASMGAIEQRCLVLEQKIAAQSFKIWALRSEIERLDAKSRSDSEKLRVLKSEVAELEELEREKNVFYELKGSEMKEFKQNVERFAWECQLQIENLKKGINEVNSSFMKFQGSDKCRSNCEIGAAEKRKSELLAIKEEVNRKLASNYHTRAQLQKQLQNILSANPGHKA